MAYSPTMYVNDSAPAINADNLNKIQKELTILDIMGIVPSDYAEYGSLNTSTGEPTNAANRVRTGFIKPRTVPFTFTVASGYTFSLVAYDLYGNRTSSQSNRTTVTVSTSDRLFRLVVVPTSGNVYPSNITDYFTTSFDDCDVYGTNFDANYIKRKIDTDLMQMQKISIVPNDYAEYGSISTSTGLPTDTANRIRSGFIKPNSVPFTVTIKNGYTFFAAVYNLNLDKKSVTQNLTTFTLSNADEYLRIAVKPDTGNTVTPSEFASLFSTSFDNCVVYGTMSDINTIRIKSGNSVTNLCRVASDYAEYGSIDSTNGKAVELSNRIRTGYFKPRTVPFTITVVSGYKFNLVKYDNDLNWVSTEKNLTTKTITDNNCYYRIPVIPTDAVGIIQPSDFSSVFSTSFDDCNIYGTLDDLNVIRKKTEADDSYGNFSLNENLTSLTDMVWEYQNWVFPQVISYKGIRDNLYFTFTTSSGYSGVACYNYDTKELTKTFLKKNKETDDHNLIAVLMMSNGKLMCAYSGGHNTDKNEFIRISSARECIEAFDEAVVLNSSGATSYSQLFEYDDKIYLFYRTGTKAWAYRISDDFGETWSSETILVQADVQYYCQFTETTSDGILRMCCYSNPDANDTNIRLAYLHLDDMTLYDTDDATVIGTESIEPSEITIIIPIEEGKLNRLYNAAKTAVGDNKVLYCKFSNSTNGEYFVYDNGTDVKVADAGQALWIHKTQLGIAWIGTEQIAVGRATNSDDLIEIYDYSNQTVTFNKTVVDNPRVNNIRTARPMIDNNQKTLIYYYGYYNPSSYKDFTTDGVIYDLTE